MMPGIDSIARWLFWSGATIALYLVGKAIYRRWKRWWSTPVIVAPALVVVLALALHESYRGYLRQTHWLVALLGPCIVSFSIPIWEHRVLIRRYWPLLVVGITAGSVTSVVSAWLLANLLRLDPTLRLTLLPRSISTPFAMSVSARIGGVPELTAVFVILTGVFGAAIGEHMFRLLRLRSVVARGAMMGMAAHGVGTARAYQIGREEGAVSSVVMSLAGLCNVLATPIAMHLLR
jgi:predicted murein hydrolase (TIGR00659 family)